MTKPKFESMNRAELKSYIVTNREDDEAFRAYIDRLHSDPSVKTILCRCDEEGMKKLESLIKQKTQEID